MEKQNQNTSNDSWINEILGMEHTAKEISMDEAAVKAAGLEVLEVTYQGEWVSVTARKN